MPFNARRVAAFAAFTFALVAPTAFAAEGEPLVSRGADYVSPPSEPQQFFLDARQRPLVPAWKPGDPIREVPRQFHGEEELQRNPPAPVNPVLFEDADLLTSLQRRVVPSATDAFTTPLVNIPGQGYSAVFPPDPTGDVGGGYYVQAINGSGGAIYKIYNTNDGSVAAGPFNMEGLGSGGACASGFGDGIIVYDHLAQRWLLTEFSGSGNNLCVYISANSNPVTTTWTRYQFTTPTFPDYPKYGVWPDAYYVGANEGPAVYALDRTKMLAAQPATLQRKTVPRLNGLGFQLLLPISFNGDTPPPAGAPGLFARNNDDERNSPGSNDPTKDYIELFTMSVNWTTPASTTLTGPVRINEAEFDSDFNVPSGFGAINQPSTTRLLDPLLEVLMYQVYYRNFGDHESIVGNHVTQLPSGANNAGVRWFELRRTGGLGGSWSMYQQGTYAPADSGGQISRWMAASAQDKAGNIALAYSVARKTPAVFPGLSYTGRLAGDPLGTMTQAETSLVTGGSSQTNADRWGDYHQMSVDPADGCTFWFTGMYEPSGGHWDTRIASFRFDGCSSQASFTLTGTNLSQDVCAAAPSATALQPVTVTVNPVNGFNSPVTMSFPAPGLPTGFGGTYVPGVITPPATTSNANLTVTNAATPGAHDILLRGSADGVDHDLTLQVNVTTAVPGQVALTAPADGAINQPAQPVFSWAASQQVTNYTIDIATDAGFSDILLSQTLPGGATSFQPSAALEAGRQYWWRVAATNLCGTSTPSAVFTFTVTPPPAAVIEVTPASLSASVVAGESTSVPLTIGNAGTAELLWEIDSAATDCSTPGPIAWLSFAPQNGVLQVGDPDVAVSVDLDATSLATGTYTTNVCVHSTDAAHPLVAVPLTLEVTDDTIFRNGFD